MLIIRAIQSIGGLKYYWLKNSETNRKLAKRIMRTEPFALKSNFSMWMNIFFSLKWLFIEFFPVARAVAREFSHIFEVWVIVFIRNNRFYCYFLSRLFRSLSKIKKNQKISRAKKCRGKKPGLKLPGVTTTWGFNYPRVKLPVVFY